MPISGGTHTGTNSPAKLSTVVSRSNWKQLDIKAGTANTVDIAIGNASVAVDGTNAYVVLSAGESWGSKLDSQTAQDLVADFDNLYVVASTGELAHVVVVN